MSTEQQQLDPHLIEETKQQIRSLVNEIAQLAKSGSTPEEFHGQFLPRVVSALAAIGGAVWTLEEQGRLALAYQQNLQRTNLANDQEGQVRHGRLLQKVLTTGEGVLVPPHSGHEGDEQAGNPTDFLLVLGPVKTDLEVVGVVEIFQRPEARPATQQGYLRFLLQMCDLAGDFYGSRQLRHFGDRQVLWTRLEEFTRRVHESLDPREAAYTIANEGRRLIECDRVSVAINKGRKCLIEAVSGQDLFDKRSNTVRLLGQLASAVVATGEEMWYTGDTSDMAPQVEDAVQEYVDESHSKTVAVLPLSPPRHALEEEEEDPDKREEPPEPVGALIVEQIEDRRVPEQMRHRVEVVKQHSAAALANAMEHNNLFLMPVWRKLGQAKWVLRARTLPKTLSITGAILLALVIMGVWQVPFELEGKGTLQPEVKRDVYAGIRGVVTEVCVQHGQLVEEDELLVRLRSTELERGISDATGQLQVTQEEIRGVIRDLHNPRVNDDEKVRLQAQWEALQKKQRNLDAKLALYREERKELEVRSPIRGVVLKWDVENELKERPVERGDLLMRVADLNQAWELEVDMPEHRMGHVQRAYNEAVEEQGSNAKLDVEYILKSDPGTKRHGSVKKLGEAARVLGDEGNTVPIKVEIDSEALKKELPEMRPGAQVSAKVDCGHRALGFWMFHDFIAFIESRVLFTWF